MRPWPNQGAYSGRPESVVSNALKAIDPEAAAKAGVK